MRRLGQRGSNHADPARTPADLLGRVDAALTIAVTVPQTVSIALGAALVAIVDYRILLAAMAVVLVIAAAYLMGGPGARSGPESGACPPRERAIVCIDG